jgi:hypothetical protein
MNSGPTGKPFDCVEMKRRIQEQIYEETKGFTHEELLEYFRQRIANSRFAAFLQQPENSGKAHVPPRATPGSV